MNDHGQWLMNLGRADGGSTVDGLVAVKGYRKDGHPPEEVAIMEKAEDYGATAVFFEAGRDGRPPLAQAFVFVSDGAVSDQDFAQLHQRLWSWGGVPLVYRMTPGLVQLFRCAHKADFESQGKMVFKPLHDAQASRPKSPTIHGGTLNGSAMGPSGTIRMSAGTSCQAGRRPKRR